MASNTLDPDTTIFLSRALEQAEGEDMLEKQNAEQGLMLVIADEAGTYRYTAENALLATQFLADEQPTESLHDGVEVVVLLMAAYLSAQTGQRVEQPTDLSGFVPDAVKGEWNPRA